MIEEILSPSAKKSPTHSKRLMWMLGGRLAIASILLGATLYFASDALSDGAFTPMALLILISLVFASAIILAVWLLQAKRETGVARTAIIIDIIWITLLVYLSTGAGSVFSILYGVVILMAAVTLDATFAYGTAAACLIAYVALSISLVMGWLPPPPDQTPEQYILATRDLTSALLSNTIGIGAVAILATNFASRLRKAGGELAVAQRSAERLARLNDDIVRSIASGLITATESGRILTINPAARRILRDPMGQFVSRNVQDIVPSLELNKSVQNSQRLEAVGNRGDGTQLFLGYRLSPLRDESGSEMGFLLTFQDLTEIKELRENAEQAERLAVLGRLATGLAHEIRNPLNSISGSVELVRDNLELEEEDSRLLGIVVSEVGRLDNLVATMLQVGRPSQMHPTPTDLRELVHEVSKVAQAGLGTSDALSISAEVPNVEVMALIDDERMRQVVWNLVKNATEALPNREGKVTLRAFTKGQNAVIEVEDTGLGIAPEDKEHLFDMFYSGRPYGVGLGLALAKQIVDQHKGTIEARPAEPRGTIFRVMLEQA